MVFRIEKLYFDGAKYYDATKAIFLNELPDYYYENGDGDVMIKTVEGCPDIMSSDITSIKVT